MALMPTRFKPATVGLVPLTEAHKKRQELFKRLWKYYKGEHHRQLKVDAGKHDDNVTLNYSKKVVDQSVSFLFGKLPIFEIDEEQAERNDAEQYLDFVWQADPMRGFDPSNFLQGLALSGSVTGTPFIRLYPRGDEYPAHPDKETFVLLDSSLIDVITEPDDKSRVREYQIIWKSGDVWKRDRIARDIQMDEDGDINDTGTWYIAREERDRADRDWQEVERTDWPFAWAPIFSCQNLIDPSSFWGMSDLSDADINDAMNFIASNTARIIKFHGHPKTVGTGFDSSQLQATAVDEFWTVPDPDARVMNLEMQSDLASSRQYLADLKDDFHQVSSTANISPSHVNVGALSGFALKILYGPQLDKTSVKQGTYGGLLARLNAAILELAGYGMDVVVANKWKNPLPRNGMEMAQEAKRLIDAGADRQAAFEMAGYTREEAERLTSSRFLIPEA